MGDGGPEDELGRWVADLVERRDAAAGAAPGGGATVRFTESGSVIGLGRDVVVKVHAARTDPPRLRARLRAATSPRTADLLVRPLAASVHRAPGGRLATLWPRVAVLHPAQDVPTATWATAAVGLAALHRLPAPAELPPHGAGDRLLRAVDRVRHVEDARARDVARAGRRVLEDLARQGPGRGPAGTPDAALVHGDWHLGQLAPHRFGLRLLDVDDLGRGDPVWDLGRPAGFWAAGLLDDAAWSAFLDAYRRAGGPGVPEDADPWPRLDVPARAAVVVAAARELGRCEHRTVGADGEALEALSQACRRM